jgi:recombination protein RecT
VTQTESTEVDIPQQPRNIIEYIKLDSIQQSAEKALGSGGRQFLTSIISFANSNAAIMECEPRSVYTACLTAATLDLSVNPNLGQAYILPYKNKGVMQAQFQIGYRGFIQLAERSGQFKRIGVREVRDEQLIGFDHFGEPLFDFNIGGDGKTIGYMAYFELINGFYKIDFMTVEELEKHGKLYSQTYKKGFGVWKDNFAAMAKKTVIKLLLSKWAPLNTEMQKAIEEDQKVEEVTPTTRSLFEVEGAAINDEPIDIIDVEVSSEDYIVDEPTEADPLKMTDAQRRKAFAIFGKLPDDLKAKAEEGRKTLFGDKSRNDYTKDEANTWINYLQGLEEGKEQNNG